MEIKIDILAPLFRQPRKGFLIRELARLVKINHTTVRKYVDYYETEEVLQRKQSVPFDVYCANTDSRKFLNLKLYFNLELIRKSQLTEIIEKAFDYPVIVLFGSFARAMDDEASDVDVCVISDVNKAIELVGAERVIGRKVSIHKFTRKAFSDARKKNASLVNSICNGITLSGQLEVV